MMTLRTRMTITRSTKLGNSHPAGSGAVDKLSRRALSFVSDF